MASTYSNLKIQLMATGENSGTWGNVTNVNLGTALEQAIAETADVDFTSGDVTLTLSDTNASQAARAMRLNCTNVGAARNLVVPAIQKPYIVNNSANSYAVTIKVSGQTGVVVPAGKTMLVVNNGTDVVDAITHLSSATLGSPLAITSGGTGSNTATFSGENITSLNASAVASGTLAVSYGGSGATSLNAEAVVIGNGTSAVKFVAPGTDGNVLTSNGSAWVSEALVIPAGVPIGGVVNFAGDGSYLDTTWLECNGANVSQATYSTLYSEVGLLQDGISSWTAQGTIASRTSGTLTVQAQSILSYVGNKYFMGISTYDGTTFTGYIYRSTDAVTWTQGSAYGTGQGSIFWGGRWFSIGYSTTASLYYATGSGDGNAATDTQCNYMTSTDGVTWTYRQSNKYGYNFGITYWPLSNLYYMIGYTGNNSPTWAYSTDLITWTGTAAPAPAGYYDYYSPVACNDTIMLITSNYGQSGGVRRSVNSSWLTAAQFDGNVLSYDGGYQQFIAWSQVLNKFILIVSGAVTQVYLTTDGSLGSWTKTVPVQLGPIFSYIDNVASGVFILLGRSTQTAWATTDGVNFVQYDGVLPAGTFNYDTSDYGPNKNTGINGTTNLSLARTDTSFIAVTSGQYTYDTTTEFVLPGSNASLISSSNKTFIKAL